MILVIDSFAAVISFVKLLGSISDITGFDNAKETTEIEGVMLNDEFA